MEPYLDNVNNIHIRKNICKFLCNDHKLEIEKSIHNNIPVDDRICQVCNSGIESEIHFLALCPLYEPLRKRYFGSCRENDIINLLKCHDKITAFKVGNYIMKAMKLRENFIMALHK